MSNIAFINDRSIYMSAIVTTLNEEVKEHEFELYQYQEFLDEKREWKDTPDVIIVFQSTNTDLDKILEKTKGTRILIWTYLDIDRKELLKLMNEGIDGYIYGEIGVEEFKLIIREILKGNKYIHPYFSTKILEEHVRITKRTCSRPVDLLTTREWEILEMLGQGYQSRDIATHLFISEKTVKNHIYNILTKLRVKDRTNAILMAIKNKWINILDF